MGDSIPFAVEGPIGSVGVKVPVDIAGGVPQDREPKIEQVARAESHASFLKYFIVFISFYHRYLVCKKIKTP